MHELSLFLRLCLHVITQCTGHVYLTANMLNLCQGTHIIHMIADSAHMESKSCSP